MKRRIFEIDSREARALDRASNVIRETLADRLDMSETRTVAMTRAMVDAGRRFLEEGN